MRYQSANLEIGTDQVVASFEAERSDRSAALAHFSASYGNLENG